MPPRFQPFTSEHYLTLLVGFVMIATLIIIAKRGALAERWVRATLAFLNLAAYPLGLIAWIGYRKNMENIVPLHLCDLAAIVAGFALITRKPILLALTYLWGMAATTQALITPAISHGAPTAPFFHFFLQHFAIVAAALYVPLVMKWRPEKPFWKTPITVFAFSIAYQVFVLLLNYPLGTNFAFATHPPEMASLIDHLGPWPYYLISMQGIALALYFLLIIPLGTKQKT